MIPWLESKQPDLDTLVRGIHSLIPLPQAYLRVRELVNDPKAGAGEIGTVIAHDPSLTAQLLRVANSPVFGCGGRVDTVAHAVQLLGTSEVQQVALALSAVTALHGLKSDLFDPTRFWRHSVHCAVLARHIARHGVRARNDGLFVAGLLHAIGHPLLCHRLPTRMAQVIAVARREGVPFSTVERREFGFDYAQVGAALLAHWQLPAGLVGAVRHHTAPAETPAFDLDAALIHVASVLAAGAAWKAGDPDTVPALEPLALQIANLDPDHIEALLQTTEAELADALLAVLPRAAAPRADALSPRRRASR